ncbi:T9SS type A sorting domain-containing protein [Flavobacteriaceae bacterium]|nr:T9SS type A sorting domain-containing protein [Flavobacteriaceae bacterium]
MKKNYFTIALVFCLTSMGIAQNTVTVDANADLLGYANVFETNGDFAFGESWGVPDLQTIVDPANNTLTLQPNYNTWADGTDPFWVNQATVLGNKLFEGNTYVEDNTLVGSELTFEGLVTSNTLDGAGQLLFNVNNGPLEGGHQAVAANFGGAFTSTALTGDAVLVTDEGADPDENDACEPITNAGEIDGNVAVLRRGACEFGFKALAAQNAGAIAVIVVNNQEGAPIVMAGGADGESVTIPVLMVSDVVGEAIIAELANGVNTTMVLSTYTTVAFIKVFNSDFSVLKQESVVLGGDGSSFSVTYDNVESDDAVVQYGFQVLGLNANPVNEAALGSVIVTSDEIAAVNDFNAINVSVYPNPTINKINIQSDEQITNVVVYNTLGQMVKSASPDATNFSMETANLDAGIYFAKLSTEKGSKTVKFIKQ